jgi:aspartate racemase
MIGIVGGMGPYAGIDLAFKLTAETRVEKDQEHLPFHLISIPERIADRSAYMRGEDVPNPGYAIVDVILALQNNGCTIIGIPCVTAHSPVIRSVLDAAIEDGRILSDVLHTVEETVGSIRRDHPGVSRVGALSTTASWRARLFLDALDKAGFEVIEQDPWVQDELVNPAIFHPEHGIKVHADPVSDWARGLVVDAIDHLEAKGAEAVILGCTELPVAIAEPTVHGVHCIDPTRALARGLVRTYAPEKLAPLPI